MEIKIFWKNACPNCPPAKVLGNQLEEIGKNVTYHNTDEVDGLTESLMHKIMATPSVVVTDSYGKELKSWRGSVPSLEDVTSL